MEIKYQEFW